MICYRIFPGGKRGAVTFSFDDGPKEDEGVIALLNKYGLKGTFHLNAIWHKDADEKERERLRALYLGHEVACHTFSHGFPRLMPPASLTVEILRDRKVLEGIFGYPVIGMSYPFGDYDDEVVSAMRASGIVYSRTTRNALNAVYPDSPLTWAPSCHHTSALEVWKKVYPKFGTEWTKGIFFVWGHSFEFKTEEDWATFEGVLAEVSGKDNVWYATLIDIYNYTTAQKNLQISLDERIFYNPSSIDVWVERDNKDIIHVPAGKTVVVE